MRKYSFDVDVVLSTYNGQDFLLDFLRSLEKQTYKAWRLIVRDDGSTDKTLEIIENWASGVGNEVIFLNDGLGNLGVVKSFSLLLSSSSSSYVMLADQDDFWLEDKIDSSLAKILERESVDLNEGLPILVYSDLMVVDENLNIISKSFHKSLNYSDRDNINKLFLRNVAPGCSMIVNRKLLDLALPIPDEAIMHDWWLMLVANEFGESFFLENACIKYRQHSLNTVGVEINLIKRLWKKIKNFKYSKDGINQLVLQCVCFRKRFEKSKPELSGREFAEIKEVPCWKRYFYLKRKGYEHKSFMSRLKLFFYISIY